MIPMRRLLVVLAAAVALPGCPSEDPYPLRPAGGGGGGAERRPDAADLDGDGGLVLTGRICVIVDFENRLRCVDDALARGALVRVVGDGTTTRSDASGEFSIGVTASPVTLEVGGEAADSLVATRSRAVVGAGPVDAPAVERTRWEAGLATISRQDDAGAAVLVYVVDADGPVVAATVAAPGASVYYDDDGGGWSSGAGTGAAGLALVLDVPGDVDVRVDHGPRNAVVRVPTAAGAVGVAVVTLPPP
jgi:hypothetical protein